MVALRREVSVAQLLVIDRYPNVKGHRRLLLKEPRQIDQAFSGHLAIQLMR